MDEILIQLATVVREKKFESTPYGLVLLADDQWEQLLIELKDNYQPYWSKEFAEMSLEQLCSSLLERGKNWSLFQVDESGIVINPVFGRLIAEMRLEDE